MEKSDEKLDQKMCVKKFSQIVGLPDATVQDNIKRLIANDQIVIIAMEFKG